MAAGGDGGWPELLVWMSPPENQGFLEARK